jgi:hypothetical protein
MNFSNIFREERHYCNHFFRLLCHDKEGGGINSGLGAILNEIGISGCDSTSAISNAQIYTEVAVFRDVFAACDSKEDFLDNLYKHFLPIISEQYKDKIENPITPGEIRKHIGQIHPNRYGLAVSNFGSKDDINFYREFSALFNAKPDFLIKFENKMYWIEAKFWEAFNLKQLQRTRNIATLCSSDLFAEYFNNDESRIILLGSNRRHKKAQSIENTHFLSWESCYEIAKKLLPHGDNNYTTMAFKQMLDLK